MPQHPNLNVPFSVGAPDNGHPRLPHPASPHICNRKKRTMTPISDDGVSLCTLIAWPPYRNGGRKRRRSTFPIPPNKITN